MSTSAKQPVDDYRWYLVQCKPRQEARAQLNLRNQGFTCFTPMQDVQRLRHGKKTLVTEALFPGYLFVNLCRLNDNWHSIRSTRGVTSLVRFGRESEPLPVPDVLIEHIRQRLNRQPASELFAPGSKVRLIDGPFKDLEAVFSKTDGEERAIILLNILQREQRLKVPLTALASSG